MPNIFEAMPADYEKPTQRIWHETGEASYVNLPVVPVDKPQSALKRNGVSA